MKRDQHPITGPRVPVPFVRTEREANRQLEEGLDAVETERQERIEERKQRDADREQRSVSMWGGLGVLSALGGGWGVLWLGWKGWTWAMELAAQWVPK